MAGIDETGLSIKRFTDLKSEIYTEQQARISPSIVQDDDTVVGQFNNIISNSLADLWALAQAVNDNFNLNSAEGQNLDDLAALRNVYRLSESSTNGTQRFTGTVGTTITAGRIIQNPVTLDRFTVKSTVTLSLAECITADFSVKTLLDNTLYSITVNNVAYQYTSDADATEAEILAGLKAEIDADLTATWSATIVDTTLTITSDDAGLLEIFTATYIGADSVTVQGQVEAEEAGDIIAPAQSVTQIITPVSGWTSTTNPSQLTRGRERETDEELRARIYSAGATTGKATAPSIKAALQALSGVSSVAIAENVSMVTDGEGRPPKTYEVVVVGGTNADIAASIYDTRPAGMDTYGAITEFVTDVNGEPYAIRFSRPLAKTIAVRVTYTLYSEEVFPVDGEQRMEDAVIAHVNALGLDVDVITGRMYGELYASAAGLQNLTVEVQVLANAGDTPNAGSWQEATLAIGASEFASITAADVYIVAA